MLTRKTCPFEETRSLGSASRCRASSFVLLEGATSAETALGTSCKHNTIKSRQVRVEDRIDNKGIPCPMRGGKWEVLVAGFLQLSTFRLDIRVSIKFTDALPGALLVFANHLFILVYQALFLARSGYLFCGIRSYRCSSPRPHMVRFSAVFSPCLLCL